MRVNARLDDERAEKLRQLQSLTRLSASEIVKRAIDLLYRQQAGVTRPRPHQRHEPRGRVRSPAGAPDAGHRPAGGRRRLLRSGSHASPSSRPVSVPS